jgi:hypothetical protein
MIAKDAKKDDKDWMPIPKGFIEFISMEKFRLFLESLLDYCTDLFKLEARSATLKAENKARGLPPSKTLESDKRLLQAKAKRMANYYAWIVFNRRCIPNE